MSDVLIDCNTLAGLLETPVPPLLLDVRVDLAQREEGRARYFGGHLPGARFIDLERDLSDMTRLSQGRHPWPDARDFAATLGALGVAEGAHVVVYDQDSGAFAARAWWLLRTFGHPHVQVLDGGFARWQALGLPVEVGAPQPLQPTATVLNEFDASALVDSEDVALHLAHGGMLVDARAAPRFKGEIEPLDTSAGHVPGAVNRPYTDNLTAEGCFKSREVLYAEFAELLAGRNPGDLVVMCGSGVTACHHLLAMAHAGLEGAKLYTGSWSGWISDGSRPVATGA